MALSTDDIKPVETIVETAVHKVITDVLPNMIREIVTEVVHEIVDPRFDRIESEIRDIKLILRDHEMRIHKLEKASL